MYCIYHHTNSKSNVNGCFPEDVPYKRNMQGLPTISIFWVSLLPLLYLDYWCPAFLSKSSALFFLLVYASCSWHWCLNSKVQSRQPKTTQLLGPLRAYFGLFLSLIDNANFLIIFLAWMCSQMFRRIINIIMAVTGPIVSGITYEKHCPRLFVIVFTTSIE